MQYAIKNQNIFQPAVYKLVINYKLLTEYKFIIKIRWSWNSFSKIPNKSSS